MTTEASRKPPPQLVIDAAIQVANRSPCAKSKRGVVIFDPVSKLIFGRGFNAMPFGVCTGAPLCRAVCADRCIHAETGAIAEALSSGNPAFVPRFQALHVKTVDGHLVESGGPSCIPCAQQVVRAKLDGFWLYSRAHGVGAAVWHMWSAVEFYEASLMANGVRPPTTVTVG